MPIEPTVGRMVWYRPGHEDTIFVIPGEPLSANVARVWPDGKVSLSVSDAHGCVFSRERVTLVQDDETPPEKSYCEWMPYQKSQAKKTEEAEAKLCEAEAKAKEAEPPPAPHGKKHK